MAAPPLFRTRKQVALVKTEVTPGVDPTPVIDTDAVQVKFPVSVTHNFESIETDYTTSSLTQGAPITGGGHIGIDYEVKLAARGADLNALFATAGFNLTFTSAAVTGAVAGGSAGSVILASSASAVTNAYQGMLLRVANSGGTRLIEAVITSYDGSSKTANIMPALAAAPDTTMTYSIPAGFLYRPVSAGLQNGTSYLYDVATDNSLARLHKLLGGASNFSLTMRPSKLVEAKFAMRGQMPATPIDVGAPQYADAIGSQSSVYYTYAQPAPFLNAQVFLDFVPLRFTELTFDLGCQIQMFDDPAAPYGYGPAVITSRKATGKFTPDLTAVSSVDNMSYFMNSTVKSLWAMWGPVGNKSSIYIPRMKYTGNEPGDNQGFVVEGIPFRSIGVDSEIFLFFTNT